MFSWTAISSRHLSPVPHCAATTCPPTRRPRSEVASIRPTNPDELSSPSGCETDRGLNRCSNVTLKRAIIGAYHVVPDHVLGGPDWIHADHFDHVKPIGQIRGGIDAIMQTLLAERFNLQLHREVRTGEALVMEVAKNGIKIQAANAAASSYSNGHGRLDATGVTMGTLAEMLSRDTRLTVVDRTGERRVHAAVRPQIPMCRWVSIRMTLKMPVLMKVLSAPCSSSSD